MIQIQSFPHCSQHPLQHMFSSLHSTLKILTCLVCKVSKTHHILVSTEHSPSQTSLYVPPYSISKQTLCYFLYMSNPIPHLHLSLFLTTWHSGISFKVLLHIPSTVKPLWVTTKLWSCICTFYHPLQFMFAFSTALLGIHMCLTFVERAMFESPLNFQNLAQCLAYGKPLINTCQWNEFMNQLHHWI